MRVDYSSEKPAFVPKKLTILFETEMEFDLFVALMGSSSSAAKAAINSNLTLRGELSSLMVTIFREMVKR